MVTSSIVFFLLFFFFLTRYYTFLLLRKVGKYLREKIYELLLISLLLFDYLHGEILIMKKLFTLER